MKIYLEELTTQALIPREFFDKLRAEDSSKPDMLALACTLQSPALCWHLSPHIKGQLISNSKVSEVSRFFRQTIHDYTFLTSDATLKEKAELDDSLSDGLVTYLKWAIDSVASHILLYNNLLQCNQFLFQKPAQIFEYLALIYQSQRYVLKRKKGFIWHSACDKVRIIWHNNWNLWTTVLSYLSGIFSRKDYTPNPDVDTTWSAYVCTSAIPTCHHAITMWVLLLWTSNSISPTLERASCREEAHVLLLLQSCLKAAPLPQVCQLKSAAFLSTPVLTSASMPCLCFVAKG